MYHALQLWIARTIVVVAALMMVGVHVAHHGGPTHPPAATAITEAAWAGAPGHMHNTTAHDHGARDCVAAENLSPAPSAGLLGSCWGPAQGSIRPFDLHHGIDQPPRAA